MSADPFTGLRPAVRARLSAAVAHLRATGTLSRADIMAAGEVSANQATTDLRTIAERIPGLMHYDPQARRYVLSPPDHDADARRGAPGATGREAGELSTDFARSLAAWADRHRGGTGRATWIAAKTDMPRSTVEKWLGGRTPDAAPIVLRLIALHERRGS